MFRPSQTPRANRNVLAFGEDILALHIKRTKVTLTLKAVVNFSDSVCLYIPVTYGRVYIHWALSHSFEHERLTL